MISVYSAVLSAYVYTYLALHIRRCLKCNPVPYIGQVVGWGHSVTPNNSLKSSPKIFKFYILVNNHILDSLRVFFRSENGILLYV